MYKISEISITTFALQHIQACYEPRTYCCLVFALLIWLFTCSTTTLVNTVFICLLTRKNKSLSLTTVVERVDLFSCSWATNESHEWDITSAYLSLCRVGMTRQSDSSIVFQWKKPVKFASVLHHDSVPLSLARFANFVRVTGFMDRNLNIIMNPLTWQLGGRLKVICPEWWALSKLSFQPVASQLTNFASTWRHH